MRVGKYRLEEEDIKNDLNLIEEGDFKGTKERQMRGSFNK